MPIRPDAGKDCTGATVSMVQSLRSAITVGIGLFLALIALKSAGIVVGDKATLVTLGDLHSAPVILAVLGFLAIVALDKARVPGAILIGIVGVTVASFFFGGNQFRMVMPQRGNGNSRQSIEIDSTVGIGYPAAVTVAESNGQTRVGIHYMRHSQPLDEALKLKRRLTPPFLLPSKLVTQLCADVQPSRREPNS